MDGLPASLGGLGLLDERLHYLDGSFERAVTAAPIEKVALLSAGAGAGAALEALYDRITLGGFVAVDGPGPGAEAVEAFRSARGVTGALEPLDPAGGCWRKVG